MEKKAKKVRLDKDVISFYRPREIWGEFSNYYHAPITYNDVRYQNSEAAFQAQKFIWDGAPEANVAYAEQIARAATPNEAKYLGRQDFGKWYTKRYKGSDERVEHGLKSGVKFDPNWEERKNKIMFEVLWIKFSEHRKLGDLLISTGSRYIQEKEPHDYIWGTGRDGSGENRLGRTLMAIRGKLVASRASS